MNRRSLHFYEFGLFRLNLTERLLERSGELVPLTPKVFDTLAVLVENSGHVVEKSELMEQLWPNSFVEESSLTQNISLLRRALAEGGDESQYIETIPKRGYRFIASVTEVEESADALINTSVNALSAQSNSAAVAPASTDISDRSEPIQRRFLKSTYLPAVSACLALAAVLTVVFLVRAKRRTENFRPKSVAVLPFKTIGTDKESDLLGLGMADALILKLSRLDQVTVLPTSAVFNLNSRDKDPVALGKELGVEGILDGTVQKDGDWVRVTAQLIRLSDGKTVWSGKFDERYGSIFRLQDSISDQLSTSLRFEVSDTAKPPKNRATDNPAAYQDYITGLYFWNRRTRENLPKAIQYLEQAVQKDPNFAEAHAMLADSYYLSVTDEYAATNVEEALTRAENSVNKALALDDTVAEAHIVKAGLNLMTRRFEEAGAEFQRGLELKPNYAIGHVRYAYFLFYSLRLDQAVMQMRRAQELDPVSAITNGALAGMLYTARSYDESISYSKRSLELEPKGVAARLNLGEAYIQKRMFKEAHEAFDQVLPIDPRYASWEKAYAYALAGRRQEALRMLAAAEKHDEGPNYFNHALVYGAMGDLDKAFEQMDKIRLNRGVMAQIIFDPQFDPIRRDSRFPDFLKRHNLKLPSD
jgi:DNA-binding winged helix-turn-helix (wHTH) protein/TolB-like protein/Tfp pilus assembly protein PilF